MGQVGNSQICANCGTANSPQDQFCSNCGYTLAGGPPDMTMASSVGSNTQTQVASTVLPRRITGALTPGFLLDQRYRILAIVGKGGFGAVYKATDSRFPSQPVVAIKEMSDGQLSPTEKAKAIHDFKNEADLLVQLKHENLPNVSNVFDDGGKVYLVMEFIEGKTLETVLEDRGGPLDEALVMNWGLQLCSVLYYLHSRPQPVIFRDMKPANVMVTTDGKIKLIDFGIARIFKAVASKDTTLLGSHGYAPLEQYGRGQSDARSDIYALGATLYHLLTNEVPADAPARHVHAQLFVPPRQLVPNISQNTEDIILKAMNIDPRQRYQTAAEMYQAIASTGIATISNPLFPVGGTPSGSIGNTISSGSMATQVAGNYPNTPQTLANTVIASGAVTPQTSGTPFVPPQPGTSSQGTNSTSGSGYGAPTLTPPVPPIQAPAPGSSGPNKTRRNLLIGGAVVAAAATGIYFVSRPKNNTPSTPTGTDLEITFTYSTEKQEWMESCIEAFNQQKIAVGNHPIKVKGTSDGSVHTKDAILNGSTPPIAWSPASSLELNLLNYSWQQKHPNEELTFTGGEFSPKSLVRSPLVFAIWEQRAAILKQHYGEKGIDWPNIHDAVLKNAWDQLGGPSGQGAVKLGQTRPDLSNSGLLAITLIAYAFHKKGRNLSAANINNADFLKYFGDIEGAVQRFGRSSGTYFTDQVIQNGQSSYDITMTYENLVLTNYDQAVQKQKQALLPFYPQLNIFSDHPFAIFKGDKITQEQQQAAMRFRDFLLAEEQQKKAVQKGFRPGDSPVTVESDIENNPFKRQIPGITLPTSFPNLAQVPTGEVVNTLLEVWISNYGTADTALSDNHNNQKGFEHDVLL